MKRLLLAVTVAVTAVPALALATACGPIYKDTDDTPQTARVIPTDFKVDDTVDADEGDKVDWKTLTPMETGTATLTVRVGDPFKGKHTVQGTVSVFDLDAREYARAEIRKEDVRYDLRWEAEGDKTYLVKIEAKKGKAPYSYEFELAPADPCARVKCSSGFACKAGRCVALAVEQPDEPDEPDVDTAPCPGGCGAGEYCSKRYKRCVKDPCYGKKCGADERCVSGRCKPISKPGPTPVKGCDPPCASGEECRSGRCVDPNVGPISARVIQAIPRGNQTEIILNKGKSHGVSSGQTGTLAGVGSFKIIAVYPTRSKALVDKPSTAVSGAKSATINR